MTVSLTREFFLFTGGKVKGGAGHVVLTRHGYHLRDHPGLSGSLAEAVGQR